MSTGAPLNLPKPKATTNTGQDMIELGNSLQKINDVHAALMGRVGALEGVPTIKWNSDDRIWHDKPSGYYYQGNLATGYPSTYGMVLHMKSPVSNRYMAQLFIAGDGIFRIRAMNQTGGMDWVTIS